jgi:hypothetical protein
MSYLSGNSATLGVYASTFAEAKLRAEELYSKIGGIHDGVGETIDDFEDFEEPECPAVDPVAEAAKAAGCPVLVTVEMNAGDVLDDDGNFEECSHAITEVCVGQVSDRLHYYSEDEEPEADSTEKLSA